MKKEIKLAIMIAFATAGVFTGNGHAQVTIGSEYSPHSGALLDLKENNNPNTNSSKGLLLPRVSLTDDPTEFALSGGDPVSAVGMWVWNTNRHALRGAGTYQWNGTQWQEMKAEGLPALPEFISINVVGNVCDGELPFALTASSEEISNPAFKWYADQSSITPLATGTTYAPGVVTLPANFYVSVRGSDYSENEPDNRKEVTVLPPPLVISIDDNKEVLRTMRATNSTTADFVDLTTTVRVTPEPGLAYSWTVTKLYTTGVDELSTAFSSYPIDDDLNGTSLSFTANATGTSVIGGAYKVEVTATCLNGCTAPATASVNIYVGCGAKTAADVWNKFMCHNLGADYTKDPFTPVNVIHGNKYKFGTATIAVTQATDISNTGGVTINGTRGTGNWDMNNANPCPAGYRVPTRAQWNSLISNNTWIAIGDNWATDFYNFSTGKQVGSALFLPAAGRRYRDGGALEYRGNQGNYWNTDSENTDNCYFLQFSQTTQNTNPIYNKNHGFPVRCIAQ